MESQDHNTLHSPGVKSQGGHVCTKCGWNYPNPHPSAKNRRAHKRICGTIKGFEILLDSEKPNLCLKEGNCLEDVQKTPSPRIVERIGDISEEDVFADAICEFSSSLVVSDSFKGKEEATTNRAVESTENLGGTQQCNSLSANRVMKIPEVVQESCEVPALEVHENFDVLPNSIEAASGNRKGSDEGHSIVSETLLESSREAKAVDGGDTLSNAGLETENLASSLGRRKDTTSDSSWNDEVIYSDVEAPIGFGFEATDTIHPGEDDCIISENAPLDTAEVISTSHTVPDSLPLDENANFALAGTKSIKELESYHSVKSCFPEIPKGEECESDTLTQANSFYTQPESLNTDTEEEKSNPQSHTGLLTTLENILISKTDPEDIEMKPEKVEASSCAAVQESVESETLRASLPAVDSKVVDSNVDVSRVANKTDVVGLLGHESELIQESCVAEENIPISKLSSQSFCVIENYVSLLEGDGRSHQNQSSTETSKDSFLQIGAEACETDDKAHGESSKEKLVEESRFVTVTNTKDEPISQSRSTGTTTTPDDSIRTEFNRVVGGLGVIQANDIDAGNVNAHYAEVPVTIDSNYLRDLGRLQNLSETNIRSLVSSPLVTRTNTSNNVFESNMGSFSGPSDGDNKPDNASQSSSSSSLAVALSKNQEITLEKTRSGSSGKEQHVPLKNLLSEARSPRLLGETKKDNESNIPKVSSILGQETSPEDRERREVSEEWNSPAKYPVERKAKGKPFWVPFVCCSSVK
ncbi:unnamed protein product [Cochlearia groenlandica]